MNAMRLISGIVLSVALLLLAGCDSASEEDGPLHLLYLRPGDPATWTAPGAVYSQHEEIQQWEAAGYIVTTSNLDDTSITGDALRGYDVVRLQAINRVITEAEGTVIHDWVMEGGQLLAEVSRSASVAAIRLFGVERIDGRHGGSDGFAWHYHGAPLLLRPVTGPGEGVAAVAAASMDRPILSTSHGLTIDVSIDSYPAIVHGAFGEGKVVIVFAIHWSHDRTRPQNAYRADIYQADNLLFLENCIRYLTP